MNFREDITAKYNTTFKYGFTLIELLIVIAIIAILAAVVIIAVNPGEQLAKARDATRERHVKALESALYLYQYDNAVFPAGIATTLTEICNTNIEGVDCGSLIDLSGLELASIPVDPQGGVDENGTGYAVAQVDNRVIVKSAKIESSPQPTYYANFNNDFNLLETATFTSISPQLGHVATLRPQEGKFGGAVAVEGGTVNLIESLSGHGSSLIELEETLAGNKIFRNSVTNPNTGNNFGIRQAISKNLNSSTTHITLSFWVRVIEQVSPMSMFGYARIYYTDESYQNHSWTYSPNPFDNKNHINEWVYVSATISLNSNKTPDRMTHFYIYRDNALEGIIDYSMVQIEEKSFPTSFVEGSRGTGYIKYPNILKSPTEESTVSFWWKSPHILSLELYGSQGDYPKILPLGNYWSPMNLTLWLWDKKLRVLIGNDSGTAWATTSYLTNIGEISPNTWYNIVITWDNKQFKVFLDGEKIYDQYIANAFNNWGNHSAFVVEQSASAHPNAFYDEISIFDYAATEEEIQSWYNSGSPLY